MYWLTRLIGWYLRTFKREELKRLYDQEVTRYEARQRK